MVRVGRSEEGYERQPEPDHPSFVEAHGAFKAVKATYT
jgi:hypothetical protein